jgi:hypothetical protein
MYSNDDILSNLKFIAKIQKNEKINIKYKCVQPNNIFTTLSRTFINFDNRENTYSFINGTISRSFEIISLLLSTHKQTDYQQASAIIEDIKNACIGIENIKETYIKDNMFTSKLELILSNINIKLLEFGDFKGNQYLFAGPPSPQYTAVKDNISI